MLLMSAILSFFLLTQNTIFFLPPLPPFEMALLFFVLP